MKTYRFIYLLAASSLLLAACSRDAVTPEDSIPGGKTDGTYAVYFGAESTLSDEQSGESVGAKVSLTPDETDASFEAKWVYGDKGRIHYSCKTDNYTVTGAYKDATWNGSSFTVYFDSDQIEKVSNWKYTLVYPYILDEYFYERAGKARVQKGNAYSSDYDLMIGNSSVTSALPGKDDEGNTIVFNMRRETGIAYFHFTSTLDETLVSATLTVEGGSIARESVAIKSQANYSEGFEYSGEAYNSINLTFTDAPNAQDFKLWFNVLPTEYTSSTLDIETTAHKLTLTKKSGSYSYEAQKLYRATVSVPDTKWVALPKYDITFATVEGGKLSANYTEAVSGTTVTLTADALEGYDFINDWSVTAESGETVTVTGNTFIMPESNVTVSASFVQSSSSCENLSSNGTANCYIVPPANAEKKYKIQTSDPNGNSFNDITDAVVLWESLGTSDKPDIGTLVKDVNYSGGYITFTATGEAGNALIAAKNGNTIIWSWHIWITEVSDITYPNNAGVMMDRNLGAISNEPGNSLAIGLLYQWGRKDPFMGSSNFSTFTPAVTSKDEIFDVADGGSSITMTDAIQNPTTFYKASGTHWQGGDKGWSDTKKLIYDPCPAGYRVPTKDFYNNALISSNSYYYDSSTYGVYYSADKNAIWFPMAGDRKYNNSYEYINTRGLYWTTTLNSDDSYYYFRVRNSGFSNYQIYSAQGNSVRCQKQ